MSTKRERKEIYLTKRWAALRDAAFDRDAGLCQDCKRQGLTVAAALVHHVIPLRSGGNHWELSNLRSLCRDCHSKEHGENFFAGREDWLTLLEIVLKDVNTGA